MSFLLSPLGRVLGALVVAASLMGLSWIHGYQRGAAAERQAILTRSIDVLRERTKVDDQIRDMDDAGLCAVLGGVFEDSTCQ